MADSKGSEFIVKLAGIKLPADVEERIASEIQATVIRELARVDTGGKGSGGKLSASSGGGKAYLIPAEWRGMIAISKLTRDTFAQGIPNLAAKEIDAQGKVIG